MSKVIREVNLIYVDVTSNNNKFWRGEFYESGAAASFFGRVGLGEQRCDYPSHAVLEKKIKGKIAKGYSEQKVLRNNTTSIVSSSNLLTLAKKQIKTSSSALESLIERLVKYNIHQIVSNTNVTYDSSSGLFQTPLGIVTSEAITEARDILAECVPLVKEEKYNESLAKLLNKYCRIIPSKTQIKNFSVRSFFPNVESIQAQNDILDSLEASYRAIAAPKDKDGKEEILEEVFKVDLSILEDDKEITRLKDWYKTSMKSMHGYDHVKITNLYRVDIDSMSKVFNSLLGNIKEVLHGTGQANVLSILKSGMRVDPPATAAIAGKFLGPGTYGAVHSSKACGYTLGKWRADSSDGSGWIFVCDFAMGKVYEPTCGMPNGAPTGYDSIWASNKKISTLIHDELVVYKNDQVKVKYLLEIK